MKTKHILSLLQEGFTTIKVKFETTSRLYTYKALIRDNVEVGDFVVVYTPSAGLQLCQVMEVHEVAEIDVDADFDYKWIVQKIDCEAYNEREEREKEFLLAMQQVEREKKRQELKQHFLAELDDDSVAKRIMDGAIKSLNQDLNVEASSE